MHKNVSIAAAIGIAYVMLNLGWYFGSKATTCFYKKCVRWTVKGDEVEQAFAIAVLHNNLKLRYVPPEVTED